MQALMLFCFFSIVVFFILFVSILRFFFLSLCQYELDYSIPWLYSNFTEL